MTEQAYAIVRAAMVREVRLSIDQTAEETGCAALSQAVLTTIGRVPRHEFVPAELRAYAYMNTPLPIGYGKTISQPFIVALMTDLLAIAPGDRVLEIGTGFGYQAAVLADLGARVYSVERLPELGEAARRRLSDLGYDAVEVRIADGSRGWAEHSPFDKIMVTAAPGLIPPELLTQLAPGGRMMVPAGLADNQQLMLVTRSQEGRLNTTEILSVRFSELETGAG